MIEILIFVGFVLFLIWLIIYAFGHRKTPREYEFEKEKQYIEELNEVRSAAKEELHARELEHREAIRHYRQDSVKRSRNSLTGKIWEQVVSLIPVFKYNPADMRFMGSPVDYIVFKGMNKKDIQRIIFLEIKTGESKLTEQQEKIKRAVRAGRVSWQEYRV